MADSAKAATADARRTLLALACLLSAFFLNQVPPFVTASTIRNTFSIPIIITSFAWVNLYFMGTVIPKNYNPYITPP
jgi:hypothetical protein|nr:MAG TPA: hypothetical protein [Caudoviricetes sp.]